MAIFGRFNGLGIGQAIQNRNEIEMANRNAALNSLSSGFQRMFDKMEEDKLRRAALKREDALRAEARKWAVDDAKDNRDFQDKQGLRSLLFNMYGNVINAQSAVDAARMQSGALRDPDMVSSDLERERIKNAIAQMSPELKNLIALGLVENPFNKTDNNSETENPVATEETPDAWTMLNDSFGNGENPMERFNNVLETYRQLKQNGYDESSLAKQFGAKIGELMRQLPASVEGFGIDDYIDRHAPEFTQFKQGRKTEQQGKKADEKEVYNKKIKNLAAQVKSTRKLPPEAFDDNGKLNKLGKDIINSDEILSKAYKAGNIR